LKEAEHGTTLVLQALPSSSNARFRLIFDHSGDHPFMPPKTVCVRTKDRQMKQLLYSGSPKESAKMTKKQSNDSWAKDARRYSVNRPSRAHIHKIRAFLETRLETWKYYKDFKQMPQNNRQRIRDTVHHNLNVPYIRTRLKDLVRDRMEGHPDIFAINFMEEVKITRRLKRKLPQEAHVLDRVIYIYIEHTTGHIFLKTFINCQMYYRMLRRVT